MRLLSIGVMRISTLMLAMASAARPSPDELKKQVADTERAFAATMKARDHAAFTSFLADEAIFFAGPTPLRGREAVANAWRKYYDGARAVLLGARTGGGRGVRDAGLQRRPGVRRRRQAYRALQFDLASESAGTVGSGVRPRVGFWAAAGEEIIVAWAGLPPTHSNHWCIDAARLFNGLLNAWAGDLPTLQRLRMLNQ